MYVRRARADRLPLVRAGGGRSRARASASSSARTASARPTSSRRSATWPRWTVTGSPPTRRWSGPAPTAAVDPVRDRPRRARAAGRAGDRAGQGEPGPARPVAGAPRPRRPRRAADGAVRARGPRAGPRRPGRAPALPRRPAGGPPAPVRRGARRLRPGASSSATPCCAPRTWPARSAATAARTCPRWTSGTPHLAQHGAELLAGPAGTGRGARAAPGQGVRRGGGRAGRRPRSPTRSRLGDALPPDRAALEQALLAALAERRPAEVERGVTLVGPHRDDLALTLGDLPAKGYASHGESWSFALALRLAAYDLLRADGIEPVLVLDDVFAELDAGRRERLAELVADASQLHRDLRGAGGRAGAPLRGRPLRRSAQGGAPCR